MEAVNNAQKNMLGQTVKAHFGKDLTGKHFALWGLAFKLDTDDRKDASSRTLRGDMTTRSSFGGNGSSVWRWGDDAPMLSTANHGAPSTYKCADDALRI